MSSPETQPYFGTQVHKGTRDLILQFYALADLKTETAATEIAELFTENGQMHGIAAQMEGRNAIREGREKSWLGITNRRHRVLEVFCSPASIENILVVGSINAELDNGKSLTTEFVGKFSILSDDSDHLRIALYKSWADSAPWLKALQK